MVDKMINLAQRTPSAMPASTVAPPVSPSQAQMYVIHPDPAVRRAGYMSHMATEEMLRIGATTERDLDLRSLAAERFAQVKDSNANAAMKKTHASVARRLNWIIKGVSVAGAAAYVYMQDSALNALGWPGAAQDAWSYAMQNLTSLSAITFIWTPVGIVIGGSVAGSVLKRLATRRFNKADNERQKASDEIADVRGILRTGQPQQQTAPAPAPPGQVSAPIANIISVPAPANSMLSMLPPPPPPTVAIY